MAVKKTIAIIEGSTTTGLAVAKILAKQDHRLLLLSPAAGNHLATPDLLKKINPDTEIEIVQCQVNACWEADTIILAITATAPLEEIAGRIREVVTGKTIVCITNDEVIKKRLEQLLPYSPIVTLPPDELPQQADKLFDKLLAANTA